MLLSGSTYRDLASASGGSGMQGGQGRERPVLQPTHPSWGGQPWWLLRGTTTACLLVAC